MWHDLGRGDERVFGHVAEPDIEGAVVDLDGEGPDVGGGGETARLPGGSGTRDPGEENQGENQRLFW